MGFTCACFAPPLVCCPATQNPNHPQPLPTPTNRAQSAGAKGGRIPKLRGVADGGGDGAGVTSIAGRRLLGDGDKGKDEDVEIDLKAAAAQRALLPAEGKRSKKRRALRELGQALEKEEEGEAAAATAAGPSSSSGGRKVDASSLLLHVEGEEDEGLVPSAAALAVAGADVDVLDGEEEEEEGAEGAVVLRGGLLHRLPSERERCVCSVVVVWLWMDGGAAAAE